MFLFNVLDIPRRSVLLRATGREETNSVRTGESVRRKVHEDVNRKGIHCIHVIKMALKQQNVNDFDNIEIARSDSK